VGPTKRCLIFASRRLDAIDECFQEQGGGAATSLRATSLEYSLDQVTNTAYCEEQTYVAEVSIGGIDLWAVIFVEGHAPESIVLGFPSDVELLPK
jgi:nitrous oxide reductase